MDSTNEPIRPGDVYDAPAPHDVIAGNGGGAVALYTVTGVITSPDSAAVGGFAVQLVDKNVGGDVVIAQAQADQRGEFTVRAEINPASLRERHKVRPDLQVQALQDKQVVARSVVRYNATASESLDVALPAGLTLPSEYETLRGALSALYSGPLAQVRETEQQQDITFLANKSGWDGRAIAMASIADQLSAQSPAATKGALSDSVSAEVTAKGPDVDPAFYYALLRAGLPSDPVVLHRLDASTVQAVWEQAIANRVIPPALKVAIPQALNHFRAAAIAEALTAAPTVGPSTLGDLLNTTLGSDAARQQQFAEIYAQYQKDPAKLWSQAEQVFGADTTARLQLDGQLAYLTVNNAPLMAALHSAQHERPLFSAADLAARGYGEASAWVNVVAGVNPPGGIAGGTIDEQRAAYAELLAAHVRIAFPTATVAHLVNTGACPLTNPNLRSEVTTFLAHNQAAFDLGHEPVARYVERSGAAASKDVIAEVTRLQRVYQITPNHATMAGLLQAGVDSAYQAANLGRTAFLARTTEKLGGESTALLVFSRACGVASSTLNVALGYLGARRAPSLGTGVWGGLVNPLQNWNDLPSWVHAQATLDDLFSNLDYCACDDCKSIIGPAAYLVDLLLYLESGVPGAAGTPLNVLLGRRPDIAALPLTCDNTNIALPYLDLVNETLEHFVGNHMSMTGYAGHSTDSAAVTSAELVAAPQNDDDANALAAYGVVKHAWFPPPLPFHRDLERLRRRVRALGSSLYDVMFAVRQGEALEAVPPATYGWRDILAERVGISRLEYQLLTNSTTPDLAQAYGYADGTDVVAAMSPLQEFSRRCGVSYDDIATILETRFINPSASLMPLFQALGVEAPAIQQLHDNTITATQFVAQLSSGVDPTRYGAAEVDGIPAWVTANYDALMGLIVIDVDGSPCDTTQMVLRYFNPDIATNALREVDLLRLLRFIRLWRRLGLTVQQTDDLLSAMYEPTTIGGLTDLQRLDSGFSIALPRIGVLYQVIDVLGLDVGSELSGVLALWAPMASTGGSSLYSRMFLNPTIVADPAQPNPFLPALDGTVPSGGMLLAQKAALCAALNLTSAEFDLITGPGAGLGYDGTTVLSLNTISAVFRRAWLARALQLSLVELLNLRNLTGIDPFLMPVLDDAQPVSVPTLDFIRLAQGMSSTGLTPVQALYLLWNVDLSGVSVPATSVTIGLAAALRSAFIAVEAQFAVTPNTTLDTARALMSLVLGAAAASTYVQLLNQTNVTAVPFGYSSTQLPGAVVTAGKNRVAYDDLSKQLSYTGDLDATTLGAMEAAAAADAALLAGLATLGAAAERALDAFFEQYDDPALGLRTLYVNYVASADPATLGNLPLLLGALLPVLAERRKQQQALSALTAAAGTDPAFASGLLDTAGVIPSVPTETAAQPAPAVDDCTALSQGGLTAAFFFGNDPTAVADKTYDVVPSLAYSDQNRLRPAEDLTGNPFAAVWSGFIVAPKDGNYNVRVALDAGATLQLTVDGAVVAGAVDPQNVWSNTAAIILSSSTPVSLTFTARGLVTTFAASWEAVGSGWQAIPNQSLLASRLVDNLRISYLRFLKASGIAGDLTLSAAELVHLATAESLTVAGKPWPSVLAVDGPVLAATKADLTKVLVGILTYARLKSRFQATIGGTPVTLLDALNDLERGRGTAKLLALTRWDAVSLPVLLKRICGAGANLATITDRLGVIRRLDDAFALVRGCRLSASTLIEGATNDPQPDDVHAFEAAMRSRYAEPDWLAAIRPANDELRELQRDALVAYILVQKGSDILTDLGITPTPNRVPMADDLFNWFLMDVEMQPCMETSRIRHALSSVQLFTERCLRNLEPQVNPSSISASQWEWRKRYRVWQANREVFLWPENWMDPSLRDDQSPIFKEALGKLLQGDITDDAAAGAYLDYLANLELVAKLEPCALYYQPASSETSEHVHAVARSAGIHRKYYHRQYDGVAWTPWQEIKQPIEDEPLCIYVWNGRVMLLWLRIYAHAASTANDTQQNMPKGDDPVGTMHLTDLTNAVGANVASQTALTVTGLLCFSEYYNGQWQPVRTSEIDQAADLSALIDKPTDRRKLSLRAWENTDSSDEALYVQVAADTWQPWVYASSHDGFTRYVWNNSGGFVLHNTHSSPLLWKDVDPVQLDNPSKLRVLPAASTSPRALEVEYGQRGYFGLWFTPSHYKTLSDVDVLTGSVPQGAVPAQPLSLDQWDMPFFFRDVRNVFYVRTGARIITLDHFGGFGVDQVAPAGILDRAKSIPPIHGPFKPVPPSDPVEATQGLADPAEAQRMVAGSDQMRAVIGAGDMVSFDGRVIGATGSVASAVPAELQAGAANGEVRH